MATEKPQRNLRLEDETYYKLVAIAKDEERSFSNQVKFVLKRYLADYEKEHGPVTPANESQE